MGDRLGRVARDEESPAFFWGMKFARFSTDNDCDLPTRCTLGLER